MIISLLFILHFVIAVLLIVAVLLQSGKGGGLAAGLGGSGATNLLGNRGTATFLSKATTTLAISFMVSCIVLTIVYNKVDLSGSNKSNVQELLQEQPAPPQSSPALPTGTGSEEQVPGTEGMIPVEEGESVPATEQQTQTPATEETETQ